MRPKKQDEPKRMPKKAAPTPKAQPRGPYRPGERRGSKADMQAQTPPVADAVDKPTPRRAVDAPAPPLGKPAKSTGPKITLYRHSTAPRYGDPQLDKIASEITHGIARRSGKVFVAVPALATALKNSKNAKWRNATPNQWCDAVLAFLQKSLAHRTKLLFYKSEGATIFFKAVWRMPPK